MPRPKQHHYDPKWYLKGFIDPQSDCVHAYDKTTKKCWPSNPKNVMGEINYYQQKHAPDGVDPDVLEKWLSEELEPKAEISLKKLRTRPKELTPEDIAYLLTYLDHQHGCVPRQIEIAKHVTISMLLNRVPPEIMTPELWDAIARGEITIQISDDFRFNVLKMTTGLFARFFLNMAWRVVKAEEGSSFITSDNPVTVIHADFSYPFEPGIGLGGTHVVFPLDSQYLLILSHPEYGNNTAIPLLANGRIHVSYGQRFPRDVVKLTNSVILDHAKRFVVGSSKDILEKAIHTRS
jgi:hypothetical protein